MIGNVVERVPTLAQLTEMQFIVAVLLGCNKDYNEIAAELKIERSTVKYHAEEAAKKVVGDLPCAVKLAVWARGASRDVLEGRSLRFEVMTTAEPGRSRMKRPIGTSPLVADGAVTANS